MYRFGVKHWVCLAISLAVAVALRAALTPFMGHAAPYMTVFLLSSVVAYFGGIVPAITSAVAGWLLANQFVLHSNAGLLPSDVNDWPGSATFLLMIVAITLLGHIAGHAAARDHLRVEELNQAKEDYRLATEAVQGMLYVIDIKANHVRRSQGLRKLLGEDPEQVPPTPDWWMSRMHPKDRADLETIDFDEFRKSNPRFVVESRMRHAAGHYVWVQNHGIVLYDADGQPEFVYGFANDVTARRESEENLKQLAASLDTIVQDRTRDLEGFTYSVAHDLRQRIRSISINANLVSEEAGDGISDEAKDSLKRLVRAAKQMGELTDALLEHTRLSSQEPRMTPVDVTALALEAVKFSKLDGTTAAKFEIEPGMVARGDKIMVGIILQNLISNAAKFSADSPAPTIHVALDEQGFYVRDNGIGFDPVYTHKLFKPFERLHTEFEGTGIGLANVRRLVEKHGGKVWAESKPGEGATFRFTLPDAKCLAEPAVSSL